MATMKRSIREEDREVEALAMANCLMLLSRVGHQTSSSPSFDRVFECKTCSRKFPSFQALGGHRASHKRPKFDHIMPLSPVKPKTHECSICGLEFAMGQALGGHMRRHRDRAAEMKEHKFVYNAVPVSMAMPVLKRLNSKRIMNLNLNLNLDLNLMPYENDLNMAPLFTQFF